jgi:hypothetical protein
MLEIIITTALLILVTIITQSGKKYKTQQKVQAPIDINDIDNTSSDDLSNTPPATSSDTLTMIGTPLYASTATKTPMTKSSTPAQSTTSRQKTNNTPKNASKDEDDTEFDLRKAVIYSEILTPKFKDQDF